MKSIALVSAMIFLAIVFAFTRDPLSMMGFATSLPLLALHADSLRGYESPLFPRSHPGWWGAVAGAFVFFAAGLIWSVLLAVGLVKSLA